jgi:hypothetical protein
MFVFFLLYFKIVFGRILYYGNESNIPHENYLWILFPFYNISVFGLIIWSLSAFVKILANKFRMAEHANKIGIIGFILSMIFLIADPFGLWMYLDT